MLRQLAIIAAAMAAFPAWADGLTVAMGDISVITPGVPVGTVAVGEASIADVNVDADKHVIVFGKKIGTTSVVVFDQQHNPIYTSRITVVMPPPVDDSVVVRGAGAADATWSCDEGRTCIRSKGK